MSRLAADGHRWFKMKLGLGDPVAEAGTLARAVKVAGSDAVVCGDVNEGWDEATASNVLASLAGSGVRFIEQPTSRLDPAVLTRLAGSSPIPLCADESAGDLDGLPALSALGMAGVSLKLIKHGGITGVMRGSVICASAGLAVNLAGKVAETSVSAAANLHCAAAMADISFGCSPANQGLAADVTAEPPTVAEGVFVVPTGPGLGVTVDERLVSDLATR